MVVSAKHHCRTPYSGWFTHGQATGPWLCVFVCSTSVVVGSCHSALCLPGLSTCAVCWSQVAITMCCQWFSGRSQLSPHWLSHQRSVHASCVYLGCTGFGLCVFAARWSVALSSEQCCTVFSVTIVYWPIQQVQIKNAVRIYRFWQIGLCQIQILKLDV